MKLRTLTICITAAIVLAAWPTTVARLQSRSDYSVEIKLNSTLTVPCVCDGIRTSQSTDGRTPVSISVKDAAAVPLTYSYTVSGGQITGNGSSVVWNLNGLSPGEYLITIGVDDGVGGTGSAARTVTWAEGCCLCPCECPFVEVRSHHTEVKRGNRLDFEVLVSGGETNGPRTFNWKVENGTITAGQGTDSISVRSSSKKSATAVVAEVDIGRTNPRCNCPATVHGWVPIGSKNQTQDFKPTAYLILDEGILVAARPNRGEPLSEVSKDMIVSVETRARGNFLADRLEYDYRVPAGRVIGSGAIVEWDMTGVAPGMYQIAATVHDRDGRSTLATKFITVSEAVYPDLIECGSSISILPPTRIERTDDYIVRAETKNPEGKDVDEPLSWTITGGSILAGQGTKMVRVRASAPSPSVEVSLIVPDYIRASCRTSDSLSLSR